MTSGAINHSKSCTILNVQVDLIIHLPCSSGYQAIYIVAIILSAILTVSAISLNSCTVLTIWKTNVLKAKLSNFTIMLLSFIDLLHGALVMPLFTYYLLSELTGSPSCIVNFVLKNLASLVSLFSITTFSMMNHERYMGICHPLTHRTQMTKRRILKNTIIVCFLQTLVFGLRYVYTCILRFLIGSTCLAFLGHTVFVYAKIARIVQIKVRERPSNKRSVDENRRINNI